MSRSQKDITDQLQIDMQDILSSVDEAIATFTEEDRKVLQECIGESFYSRGLPFSAVAMIATKLLISRGVLKPSLPKIATHWARALKPSLPMIAIAYAGLVGLGAGTISYANICEEKFRNRENSPLGEALRQGRFLPQRLRTSTPQQKENSDPDHTVHEMAFHSETESHSPADSLDYAGDFSYSEPSSSAGQSDPFSTAFSDSESMAPGPDSAALSYMDDETPKKRTILYEDLRLKNRGNHEVLAQRTEPLLKPYTQTPVPTKEVKKNKYGDALDE